MRVVRTLFGTTQAVSLAHPGPVTTICAEATLKLLPLIVSENAPAVTLVGEMLLMDGAPAIAVTVRPLESEPLDPFRTWIVKVPGLARVTGPANCVALRVVRTLAGTTQAVSVAQPGPVTTICALAGSKLFPLIASEKVPVITVVGERLSMDGTLAFAVTVRPFESEPFDPFRT